MAAGCTTFFDSEFPDDDDEGGDAPGCSAYCAEFVDTCSGIEDDYSGFADCVDFCTNAAQWDAGSFDDVGNNTVGCRIYHAQFAASEAPQVHCYHAGITGGDVCGNWCANYCHLAESICTGENAIFDNAEQCFTACRDIDDTGTSGDTSGDTIQCRMYHLTAAYRSPGASAGHCGHASPVSLSGVCGD